MPSFKPGWRSRDGCGSLAGQTRHVEAVEVREPSLGMDLDRCSPQAHVKSQGMLQGGSVGGGHRFRR